MKSVLIVIILITGGFVSANQKLSCNSVFLKPKIKVNYFVQELNQLFDGSSEPENLGRAILLTDPNVPIAEKLIFAKDQARQLGIGYVENSYRKRFHRYQELIIQPGNQSELNRLALTLKNKFQITVVYNPKILGIDFDGAYIHDYRKIYLSHYSISTGKIDFTLLHEIRHAILSSREDHGNYAGENGFIMTWRDRWPWGQPITSGYTEYMSLQEISTYHRQLKQQWRHLVSHKKQPEIDRLAVLNYESQVNGESVLIFKEALKMYDYEIEFQKKKRRLWNLYDEKTGVIQINHLGWRYLFVTHVPKPFIQEYLLKKNVNVDVKNIKKYFSTSEGKMMKQQIVIDFLETSRMTTQKKLDFALKFGQDLLSGTYE